MAGDPDIKGRNYKPSEKTQPQKGSELNKEGPLWRMTSTMLGTEQMFGKWALILTANSRRGLRRALPWLLVSSSCSQVIEMMRAP